MDGTLIAFGEAAKRIGTTPVTLRRAVRRGDLPVFVSPLDRRARLVRIEDVDALVQPRPTTPKEAPMGR